MGLPQSRLWSPRHLKLVLVRRGSCRSVGALKQTQAGRTQAKERAENGNEMVQTTAKKAAAIPRRRQFFAGRQKWKTTYRLDCSGSDRCGSHESRHCCHDLVKKKPAWQNKALK